MMNKNSRIGKLLRQIPLILLLIAMIAAFAYGLLLIGIGLSEKNSLAYAKAHYEAVSVEIRELTKQAGGFNTVLVIVEPAAESGQPDGRGQRMERTGAVSFNWNLHIGDTLTMYCDPAHREDRVIDFGIVEPVIKLGSGLLAGSIIPGTVFLVYSIRKKHAGQQK